MTISDTAKLATKWRNLLKQEQQQLKSQFHRTNQTAQLLRQHARLVDRLLCDIWREMGLDVEVSLIAVGGYGRGELYPHSDVDILILMPADAAEALHKQVESLIGIFWDIGLAVGHSVRTLDECLSEASTDVTIETNLLESRHLTGNNALFQAFEQSMHVSMQPAKFFEAKLQEQELRHARFHDTAYNLEPNVKESPGGLRDLQTIIWIARSMGLGNSWQALVKHEIISSSEMRQIQRHERQLQMLRVHLHYLANRREDRLIFDFQNDLATELGYFSSGRKRASEQLMQSYYKSAKYINLMNEIILELLKEHLHPEGAVIQEINEVFESRNGLLNAKSNTLLQRKPATILETFLLLEQHPELEGISPQLLRTLHRVRKLVNREFRQHAEHKKLFLAILKQPNGVTDALKRMNRYGILGNYIPAFGRIVGQMQHDLFHVYTVDEHILNVLRNLHRFAQAKFNHEFPLCSKLMAEFDDPFLLYLAALFHDIAKGRGGDHSTLGTVDAKRFCTLHGLSKQDRQLVSWLVESHLLMSSTAQKSDLSDPLVIEQFAHVVGTERRLTALYLLTVADIRGTSPKVWNAWKAKLLENLFQATQRLLQGGANNVENEINERQSQAQKILSHYGVTESAYSKLWVKLGKQYFLRHTGQEIAWHSRLLLTHIHTDKPIVRARLSPEGDGIQVMIYMHDNDSLFAKICSFFERINYNILEAKVHTTQHGYALDGFLVADQSEKSVRYRDLLQYIEHELTQKLASGTPPDKPLQGRVSRQVKHMPIKTQISIQPEAGTNCHSIEIIAGDRPGLLSQLAHVLLELHIHLQTAKINTLGKRAEDSFLISSESGDRLEPSTINALNEALRDKFG